MRISPETLAVSFLALLRPPCSAIVAVAFALSVTVGTAARAQTAAPAAVPVAATPEANAKPAGFWERDTMTGSWGGVRTQLEDWGVKLGLVSENEAFSNLTGGIRTGTASDGLANASLTLDLDKLVGWNGASIYTNAYWLYGRPPTANLVGNLQLVSNVEAANTLRLYDLYLEQLLFGGKLSIRIGQGGMNDEFMLTQYGTVFLNSSFGFPALSAIDLPSGAPNFPLSTPFVRLKAKATDQLTMMIAAFNGDPAGPGPGDPQKRDASGTEFRIGDGAIVIAETQYTINQQEGATGLPATVKLGGWMHTGTTYYKNYWTVYGVVDQMLWRKAGTKDVGIGVFAVASVSPQNPNNQVSSSYAGGVNWKGMLPSRDGDVAALGFATTLTSSPYKTAHYAMSFDEFGSARPLATNETIFEMTYNAAVTHWLGVQPTLQYVVNPGAGTTNPASASGQKLHNAVVVGLWTGVTF